MMFFQSDNSFNRIDMLMRLVGAVILGMFSSVEVLHAAPAREVFSVCGEVADSLGEPEIYATVRVYASADSVRPVSLGTTDDKGAFSQTLPAAGGYRLTVASVGKELIERGFEVTEAAPTADLGKIMSREAGHELGEVEVVAQRPLVSREIDRLGYDVKADPESSTSNLRDILRKVPLVSVDNEGNIKVKGSSDFKIYKNGRPNNSFTRNAKDIFAAIPASTIKKIEVITDPGAREDAEGVGCILNIVTDSESSLKGVVGSAGFYFDSNSYIPSPNLWLSTQVDKVTVALNGGMNVTPKGRDSEGWNESSTDYYDSGNRQEGTTHYHSPYTSGWMGLESSWEPDTLNLITLEFDMWAYGMNHPEQEDTFRMTGPDGALLFGYNSWSEVWHNKYVDFDGALNYQRSTRRKGETLTLSYQVSTTGQRNEAELHYYDMVDCPFDYTGRYYNTRLNFLEQTVQADWSRPWGDRHKLDVGGKAVFRNNHSVSDYIYRGASSTHDDFTHRTTIGAAYADYRLTLGKWSLRAGVRYEYSYLSARFKAQAGSRDDFSSSLNDWVPNAAVSWSPDDANTLKLSFSRNIRRPGISYLDPARSIGPTSQSFGNPDLESEVYNNLSLNYSLIKSKFNLDFNISGSMVNNGLVAVQWLDNGIKFSTYDNVGKVRSADMSLYFQWSINDKTRWMLNMWAGYRHYSQPSPLGDDGTSVTVSRGRWSVNPWTRFSRDLPWKIEASVSAYWWMGGMTSVYSYNEPSTKNIGYSLSFTRKFLKEDRLTLRLSLNNIFGPGSSDSRSVTLNPLYRSDSRYWTENRRYVGLSVNFRFGSLNASVKKTAVTISNDDLQGRKK